MAAYNVVQMKPRQYEFPQVDRVNLRLTDRCNLACATCFTQSAPNGTYGLTTQEVKANLDFLKKRGVERVHLTGGEPFTRKDAPELITYAHGKGMIPSVLTNGYGVSHIPSETLTKLALAQVSLDGSKHTHDMRRPTAGGKGTYESVLDAIYHLKHLGVPTQISFTASLQNVGELEQVVHVAKDVGAGVIVREQIPKGFAKDLNVMVHGTQEQIRRAVEAEKARIEASYGPIFVEDPFNFVPGQSNNVRVPTINPDGTIEGTIFSLSDLRKAA